METAQVTRGSEGALVEVRGLKVYYPVKLPVIQRLFLRDRPVVHAVDGVDFDLRRGEIFGLVGESGCGKTTVGRTLLRLVEPTEGTLRFEGRDITHLKEKQLEGFRRQAQIVFQDPHAALNPAMSIGRAIGHPLEIHDFVPESYVATPVMTGSIQPVRPPFERVVRVTPEEEREAVLSIMREVGLTPEDQLYEKYPQDLSGGQKQRAVIARAMILQPKLIVADEPVAMLDMSIRAKVLELMMDLKARHGLTYLFITHDLATAKFICDRIAIMYLGRIVEMGRAKEIYADPKHPYTKALLAAIPIPDPSKREKKELPKGEVPDAVYPPAGCHFHPRCPVALPTCGWEGRDFLDFLEERWLDAEAVKRDAELGPIDAWTADGLEAMRKVEGSGAKERGLLDAALESASKPMREAIDAIKVASGELRLTFRPPADLRPKEIDGRLVECLLF